MIEGREAIRDAYRNDGVARGYVQHRFVEPLGAHLHDQQVSIMRRMIEAHQPGRVLELAPGPARITVDVTGALGTARTTVMDASAQMLAEARTALRTHGTNRWQMVQGDAFALPFGETFDFIYSFRLIRHFNDQDRARLYGELRRVLQPGGLLVFDAVNAFVSRRLRTKAGAACHHYDAELTPEQIERELDAAGFRLLTLHDVQRRYGWLYQLQVLLAPRSRRAAASAMRLIAGLPGGQPLEWVVASQRK